MYNQAEQKLNTYTWISRFKDIKVKKISLIQGNDQQPNLWSTTTACLKSVISIITQSRYFGTGAYSTPSLSLVFMGLKTYPFFKTRFGSASNSSISFSSNKGPRKLAWGVGGTAGSVGPSETIYAAPGARTFHLKLLIEKACSSSSTL